jgi:hypothetical protein
VGGALSATQVGESAGATQCWPLGHFVFAHASRLSGGALALVAGDTLAAAVVAGVDASLGISAACADGSAVLASVAAGVDELQPNSPTERVNAIDAVFEGLIA